MPKKATSTPVIPAPSVPSLVELAKLGAKDQCARFAERATVNQRAFAEMGKLHHLISAGLKKGQTIYGELRKLGVKDSTISNASYASKMIELVKADHLTEAQYDALTFADCFAISRVMGDRSARKLSGEEVKAVIAAAPDSFDAEFDSIYTTGLTVAEEIAQAEAKAQAERQAEADRKAAEQAEMQRQADEKAKADLEAKQAAEQAAQAAQNPAASTSAAPEGPAPAGPTSETGETDPGASADPGTPSADTSNPADSSAPPEPLEPAEPGSIAPSSSNSGPGDAPSNVEQMPVDPDANLTAVLDDLDNILEEVGEMSVEAKKTVFAKLNTMMAHLDSHINAPVSAAA